MTRSWRIITNQSKNRKRKSESGTKSTDPKNSFYFAYWTNKVFKKKQKKLHAGWSTMT